MEENTTTELDFDQQLNELLGVKQDPAPATGAESGDGATPSPNGEQPPAGSPPPADGAPKEGADTPAEDDPLKLLEEIKEDEQTQGEPKPEAKLSPVQEEILQAIPNEERAVQLLQIEKNYGHFTNTMLSGNFDATLKEIEAWQPSVHQGLLEHIYDKFVKNGTWVDRFIAEAEGRGHETQKITQVERELQQLKNQLAAERQQVQQTHQQTQAQQREAQNFKAYQDHIGKLFDQIKFSEADRKYVQADLNQRVAGDKKVLDAIRSGKPTAVTALFKEVVREYISHDKLVTGKRQEKEAAQDKKLAPLGGGTAVVENTLPDDIKQVPKGQEDNWMTQQLNKLFSRKK